MLNTGEVYMSTITYNAELKFKDNTDQEYWADLLEVSRLAYNECADIITTRKIHLDLQSVHNAVYYELREKFAFVMPDYDEEAVYPSDMKKVFAWYQMLMDKNLLDFTEEEAQPEAEAETSTEKE